MLAIDASSRCESGASFWRDKTSTRNLMSVTLALLLSSAGSAVAQGTQWSNQRIGNFEYTTGRDNYGTTYTGTSQQLGPFRYDSMRDNHGNSVNCTTQRIGQFSYTNCR